MIFSILWYFTTKRQLSLQSTTQHDIIDVVEEKWRSGDRRYFFSGSTRKQIQMNENVLAHIRKRNVNPCLTKTSEGDDDGRDEWIFMKYVREVDKKGTELRRRSVIEYTENDKRTQLVWDDTDEKSRNDSWPGVRSPRRWRQSNLIEPNYWHSNHQWQCQLENAWQWTLNYHHVNQLRRRIASIYKIHLLWIRLIIEE